MRGQGHMRNGSGPANRDGRDMNLIGVGETRNRRSVWTISTKPYSEAHFATFPEDLVQPCIAAGTSERGCCKECGAPWERVVEKSVGTSKECPKTQAAHEARGGIGKLNGTVGKSGSGRIDGYSETIGWIPTCNHYDTLYRTEFPKATSARKAHQRDISGNWFERVRQRLGKDHWEVKPATVLDSFSGSGTTVAVAHKMGRHGVGIELNAEYIALAERRMVKAGLLI